MMGGSHAGPITPEARFVLVTRSDTFWCWVAAYCFDWSCRDASNCSCNCNYSNYVLQRTCKVRILLIIKITQVVRVVWCWVLPNLLIFGLAAFSGS